MWGTPPTDLESTGVGWDSRICISHKFPGDIGAEASGIILGVVLVTSNNPKSEWNYL